MPLATSSDFENAAPLPETATPPGETPTTPPSVPDATGTTGTTEPTTPPAELAPPEPEPTEGDEVTIKKTDGTETRFRKRARKQQATPEDVPRIQELTKKLRDEERRRVALEQELDTQRTRPAPSQPTGERFTFPSYDAYLPQHPEATWDAYQDAKLEAHADFREARRQQTAEQQQWTQAEVARVASYATKETAFKASHTDWETVTGPILDEPITPLVRETLITHDNGPAVVYYLGQHPELLYELLLLTDGKPVSSAAVATTQRWLQSRMQAAPTGSARPTFTTTTAAPSPPNPVRTGPLNAGDTPPSDADGLDAHARYWDPKKARR